MNDCQSLVFRFSSVFLLLVAGPAAFALAAPGAGVLLALGVRIVAWTGAAFLLAGFVARATAIVIGALSVAAIVAGHWDATVPSSMLTLGAVMLLAGSLLFTALLGAGGLSVDEWLRGLRLRRKR